VQKLLQGGLTREHAVEIARLNNPHLQETYDELDVSQADLVQAGLLSNPSLGGSRFANKSPVMRTQAGTTPRRGTMVQAAPSADLSRDGIDVEGPSKAWSDASVRSG
jgi:hypothetical protein